jgi:amino acid adenylation domain-containing protein
VLTETRTLAAVPARLAITDSQKSLLVIDGQVPCRHLYNELVRFDIDPAIPSERVERALAALVTVQPALRQVFSVRPEMHARLTAPVLASELPLERALAAPREYEQAVATMARRIGRPAFDLANGPAYRFATVRASDGSASAIVLCDHHVILDGASIDPLARDLDMALSGALSDEEVANRRIAREAAFVKELAAQNRSTQADGVAARSAAWAAQLRDVPPLVLAPRPGRPAQTDFSGARVSWTLTDVETDALIGSCRRLEITPFTMFTGIYGLVLARHGNVSSVLVGSPFMARRTLGALDLGGFFVNTLPVALEIEWERTVDEHLGVVVREAVDFCRSNVDVTFNRLVADVQPDRCKDRNPLFSAMLAMQDSSAAVGAVGRVSELGNGTAKFDLRLSATPVDGRWMLELEYDCQLIAPAVADGLLSSLRLALRRAIRDGSGRVADLFADASAAVSVRSDGWTTHLPEGDPVRWVEAVARRAPDAPAVEGPSRRLTYTALLAAAERVAAGLAANGVRRGDVVGIVADDLCDAVTAILAILRCGAAYLPLDPSLPEERLAYMAEKARCSLIVGRRVLPGVRTAPVDALARSSGQQAPSATDGAEDREPPVYVMFTSGSTGRPKGVQMGQVPLRNLTEWQIAALGMDSDTRFLQYAPLSFDVSFQEILPTLASGGTIVSREPADRRFFGDMLKRIADTRVTHVYLPVPALRPLLELASTGEVHLPALRYVCVAGEQLLVNDAIRDFFVAHPHCVLVNLYGPTETHAVTSHRLSGEDPAWPAHVPIGRPYPNVAAYVVDTTGHLAPPGVAGELYLGGVCPADGYVNDPALTSSRFVPDRFASVTGARMYQTGDLVVRDHRGELIYLGRVDRQVKIRGYRIELGEIEVVASRVDGVAQAVAVVCGTGSERKLALFVSGERDAPPDLGAVRSRLTSTLPVYMQPAETFALERIPTTASGKTDRDALTRLADELLAEQTTEVAIAAAEYVDDLERELAVLWSKALGVDAIPRERPVLEYGAHSLNIFTVLAEVQERYGQPVPMSEFFGSPTIASLAELVRGALESGEARG